MHSRVKKATESILDSLEGELPLLDICWLKMKYSRAQVHVVHEIDRSAGAVAMFCKAMSRSVASMHVSMKNKGHCPLLHQNVGEAPFAKGPLLEWVEADDRGGVGVHDRYENRHQFSRTCVVSAEQKLATGLAIVQGP